MEIRTILYKSETPRAANHIHTSISDLHSSRKPEGLLAILKRLAPKSVPILLSGPTAAGKIRLAKWAHALSARSCGPFRHADLNAIPPESQMNLLFGRQQGTIQQAHRGTMFIDHIERLVTPAKEALLEILTTQPDQIRLVAGTNQAWSQPLLDGLTLIDVDLSTIRVLS